MKKKLFRLSALVLATAIAAALTGCSGSDVSGTYTAVYDSKAYYSASEVQNDMPENEMRPDGSSAMVPFRRLMPMLDSRVTDEVNAATGGGEMPETANVSDYYTVTLTLEDGSYTLTKRFDFNLDNVNDSVKDMLIEGEVPLLELEFTGTYTAEKDGKVTLGTPSKVVANVSPCGQASAYSRFGGGYEDIEAVEASDGEYPGKFFYYFNTPYFVENSAISEMTVTVDGETGNLTF